MTVSNLEHYFENLLYNGSDINGNPNKNSLTKEQQESVEACYNYIKYCQFSDELIDRILKQVWKMCDSCCDCNDCRFYKEYSTCSLNLPYNWKLDEDKNGDI